MISNSLNYIISRSIYLGAGIFLEYKILDSLSNFEFFSIIELNLSLDLAVSNIFRYHFFPKSYLNLIILIRKSDAIYRNQKF